MRNWIISLLMIPLYLGAFWIWRAWPSRVGFVVVGLLVAGVMTLLIQWGRRHNYFANRIDLLLHVYVVLDVILEAFMWEVFFTLCRVFSFGALSNTEELRRAVTAFHDNNNFYGCALFFIVVIGGHRWWALRQRSGEVHQAQAAAVK